VEGWGKIVAGVVLGVAGTVYATNEDVRKRLPKSARDLPENVRQRFETAVSAAREASKRRRDEILRDLEAHEAHAARPVRPAPEVIPEAEAPAGDEPPKITGSIEEGSA
jgi:cation transport regulator ChaB